jgi:hypothetical protein
MVNVHDGVMKFCAGYVRANVFEVYVRHPAVFEG